MKLRNGIVGTTLLFAGGCLQSSPGTMKDAVADADAAGDAVGKVDIGKVDSTIAVDTTVPADTTQPDGTACYEPPEDPLALVGQPCAWPDALECSKPDWSQWITCTDGAWAKFEPPAETNMCDCEAVIVDCAPAGTATCVFAGVGFVGIHRAGWDRKAARRLRMV